MNICVVSPSYPTPKTIVFVFVDQLCKAFADQGVCVTVIAPQSVTRCLVHREPFSPLHSIIKSPGGKEIHLYRPLSFTFGNGRLAKLTRASFNNAVKRAYKKLTTKPDVCYGHFWSSIKSLLPLASEDGIPLFGASGEECVSLYDTFSPSEKLELSSCMKGLVSVSTKNMDECTSLGLITKEKTEVIPNAINLSLFKGVIKSEARKKLDIAKDDFVVGFLGQFVPRKGTLRLAQALAEIGDSKIKAMFIGSGVEDPVYDGTIFKGRLNHDDIPHYLTACDVFVLPTENEGCSNAVIEAMACGLPIISTDAAFNHDILDDSNSILIDCHNIEQIKNAIIKLRDDFGLREKLSVGASSTANSLSLDKRAERILDFINRKI